MAVRVFLSYSHDSEAHGAQVLALANQLRVDGIDAWIDRYEVSPSQGWPRWMLHQIERAEAVLLVCTEAFCRRFEGRETPGTGRGVTWEGLIAQQVLYEAGTRNQKFIALLFGDEPEGSIPQVLRAWPHYRLPAQYEVLFHRLLGKPEVHVPPLGERHTVEAASLRPSSLTTVVARSEGLPASPPADLTATAHSPSVPTSTTPDRRVVEVFAELYPSPQQARAVWQRAGGRAGEVPYSIEQPRDMWWGLWRQSLLGGLARPTALLREALEDVPNNSILREALSHLDGM